MDAIFEWAKTESQKSGVQPQITNAVNVRNHHDIPGSHYSLFCNENGESLLRWETSFSEQVKIEWFKITNLSQMREENPSLVELWIRNGEAVYDDKVTRSQKNGNIVHLENHKNRTNSK